MHFIYPAKIQEDEGGFFLVTFRDFSFAATDGETHQGALDEATDCLEEAVAACIDEGLPVPMPTRARRNEILIVLPPLMAAKAALHNAVLEERISKSAFARLLKVNEKEGRRLLDPHHKTKVPRLSEALAALNRRLIVGVEKL